jgi:YidC/Oxa1 family membrane protein insertase
LPEIQNPNLQTPGPGGGGSGGDLRSSMVFMLLVLLVFFGYQYLTGKPAQQPGTSTNSPTQSQGQTQSQAPGAQNAAQPAAGTTPAAATAQAGAPAAQAAAATPTISATLETDTTVENELYKIVLTNRGAQVKHWTLKKYFDNSGKPLDMVQAQASEQFGLPLALFTYEPALTTELNQALYQVTVDGAQPSATGLVLAPTTIHFHYAAGGLDVVKTVQFNASYVVSIDTAVTRNGVPVRALVEWPAGLGDMEEFRQAGLRGTQVRTPSFFAWSMEGKQDSQAAAKVSGGNTLNFPYQYASVMDLYFASAFLPDNPDDATVVTLHNAIELPSNLSDPSSRKTPADVLGVAVGSVSGDTHLRLFVGPKATDVLQSIHTIGANGKPDGPSLDSLIQFGWWTVIAKPLYLVLRFMVDHGIGNWGWAILLFTLVFTLAMLPARLMMTRSSWKMMRIQPKVDAIRNRYKNFKATDPRRAEMNTEMMALYKTEGVNMYGSCLPMLVQMPLFFAYYRVLLNAVELRQAHWLWLPDLSQPDPTHVLPILIILTMFVTQYITPSPGMDPAQRRMLALMMPVVFGFMLWHYASGLALYWGTSNLIYLAMQFGINQTHMGKDMHARAAKKKSSLAASTIQGRR